MQKSVMIGNLAMSPDFDKLVKSLPKEDIIESIDYTQSITNDDGVLLRMSNDVGFILVSKIVEIPQLRAVKVRKIQK